MPKNLNLICVSCKFACPTRACAQPGRTILARCHAPPSLWHCANYQHNAPNSSDVVLQLWFNCTRPARTRAHEWCKPIRPLLFISPLRTISLPNLEINHLIFFSFSFLIIPLLLDTLSSVHPAIPLHPPLKTKTKKKPNVQWMVVFMDVCVFVASNLWSTSQCGSLGRLRENSL